jgi:diacylglycerol kinase (ATP)
VTAVPLLANRAGQGRVAHIIESARALGVEVAFTGTDSAEDTEAAARRFVAEGHERLLVAGGDGLIHLAVQAVAGTSTVLGVIPVGTGNDFLRALGMHGDLPSCVARSLADPVALDLLRIGPRWGASVATLGFSADVNARANRMRRPRGPLRYTIATLVELPRLNARPVSLEVDGTPVRRDLTLMTVANTSTFGGGMQISPGASPIDGSAELTLVGPVGRRRLVRFFRRVFDGSHVTLDEVETMSCSRVEIVTPDLAVWADGEPVATTPAAIEVVPRALRLAGALVQD